MLRTGWLFSATFPRSCMGCSSSGVPSYHRCVASSVRSMKAACWVRSLVCLPETLPTHPASASAYSADFLVSAPSFHLPAVTLPRPAWRLTVRSSVGVSQTLLVKRPVSPPFEATWVKLLQPLGRRCASRVTNVPVTIIALRVAGLSRVRARLVTTPQGDARSAFSRITRA